MTDLEDTKAVIMASLRLGMDVWLYWGTLGRQDSQPAAFYLSISLAGSRNDLPLTALVANELIDYRFELQINDDVSVLGNFLKVGTMALAHYRHWKANKRA